MKRCLKKYLFLSLARFLYTAGGRENVFNYYQSQEISLQHQPKARDEQTASST